MASLIALHPTAMSTANKKSSWARALWVSVRLGVACLPAIRLTHPALNPSQAAENLQVTAKPVPGSKVTDLTGHTINPFPDTNHVAVVLIFLANDCPISNRYAPEIRRLTAQFGAKRVQFWLVHPDPDETAESILVHAKDYQYEQMGILRDPLHELVQRARVRVTPEAAVFLPDGRLQYHGRIDDRYVAFGQARPAAAVHDLERVLQAIVEHRPVPVNQTRAIGCYIQGPVADSPEPH